MRSEGIQGSEPVPTTHLPRAVVRENERECVSEGGWVGVCVCVCERECVCVRVCVRERERKRERESVWV